MDKFLKYFQLTKVDEAQRLVFGLVTAEREDKDGETCHYESTVPQYKAVNDEMGKATDGQNIMPLREMHQLHAVGAGKSIEFDDVKKEIRMAFKVVEDSTWKKVMEKVLTGFSQGGRYIKRWKEGDKTFYTAEPGEVSLVDNPCLSGAIIEYVKADGTKEEFKVPDPPLARLTDSDIQRIAKALQDSILSTRLEDKDPADDDSVRKQSAKGADMNKEQIEKCAKALGITVEEFTKTYIEGDALEKGKKGLAALHAHLKKAHSLHEKMHTMHKAMGEHHAQMAEHLENCMKAHGACMDGEEAEKILKALAPVIEPKVEDGMKPEEIKKAIEDGIKAATEPLTKKIEEMEKGLAPNNGNTGGARVTLIGRDGKEIAKAASASDAMNPMAVS